MMRPSAPTFEFPRILAFNLLGLGLIMTWRSPNILFWEYLDEIVFFTTNAWLDDANTLWVTMVAIINHRLFDVFSLLVLMAIYLWAISRDPLREKRMLRWGGIGITMLLAAVFIAQGVGLVINYSHPSPTMVYEEVNLITELVGFATKDSSGSSFPGDHGVNLLLFSAFMWRFAGLKVMLVSLAAAIILSAPRILSGAHWFSDVYFGALAINLIITPWILLTPIGPGLSRAITRGLARVQVRLPGR